jgi:hypothetical protein
MIATMKKPPSPSLPSERMYRYPKVCLPVGLLGLAFSAVMIGMGVALLLLNADGSLPQTILAIVCVGVFGGFALLSLYLLLAYRGDRFITSDVAIRHDGVLRSTTLPLAHITRAVWRSWPRGGSVVLYTTCDRLAVHLGNYESAGELAAFFRENLPAEVQERYERFESYFVPDSKTFHRRQDREQRFFIGSMAVMGAGLVVLAFWDPYGARPWFAVPASITIVMGVRALLERWRGSSVLPR